MCSAHSLETVTAEPTSSWKTPKRLFLTAVLLWCAIPLSPQSVDSDFWGHVQYGQDTWQYGLARTATYTFTAEGYRWINHENLSELIFAAGAHLGAPSLLALKCLLGALVVGLGMRNAWRQQVGVITIATVSVIAAVNLSFYWGLRPHVFSFVLFALMIAWTDWCFEGWSGQWNLSAAHPCEPRPTARLRGLWLTPVLLFVWANTHGGFLAGVAVFAVIIGGRGVEYALSGSPRRGQVIGGLAAIALAGCCATLINPYGFGLHQWLIESLGVPRPEILEWHPPALLTRSAVKLWLLLGICGFGLIASRRPRDITQLVVICLVFSQFVKHQRHLPFLVVLCLYWLPSHVHSAGSRWIAGMRSDWPTSPTITRFVSCLLIAVSCLFAYRVGTRLTDVSVRRDEYPVAALQFMADQSLTGRMVVSGRWAQYVLGVRGARTSNDQGVRVAFDGR